MLHVQTNYNTDKCSWIDIFPAPILNTQTDTGRHKHRHTQIHTNKLLLSLSNPVFLTLSKLEETQEKCKETTEDMSIMSNAVMTNREEIKRCIRNTYTYTINTYSDW